MENELRMPISLSQAEDTSLIIPSKWSPRKIEAISKDEDVSETFSGRETSFNTKMRKARESFRKMGTIKDNKQKTIQYSPFLKTNLGRVIHKLRSATQYRKYDHLKEQFFHVLNDKSHFKENYSAIEVSKQIIADSLYGIFGMIEFLLLLTKRLFFFVVLAWDKGKLKLFNPFSKGLMAWDAFQCLLSIAILLYVPFNIATGIRLNSILDFFLIVGIGVDFLINMNTGFLRNGDLIMEEKEVIRNYFRNLIFFDFSGFLPIINIALEIENVEFIKYLFIFVFFKIFWRFSKIQEYMQLKPVQKVTIDLLKLLLFSLIICHFAGCFWLLVGQNHANSEKSWISNLKLTQSPWTTKYIYAYYWSVVTIMTVGYGDITPQNTSEIAFTIIVILFGGAIFLYNINYLGILLSDLSKEKEKLKNALNTVNKYMERKKIDYDLQLKVRHNVENIIKEEAFIDKEKENALIEKLPPNLKDELLLEANGFILSKMPFLFKNFSKHSLRSLVVQMREMRFSPGDFFCHEGEREKAAIICIVKGSFQLYQGQRKITKIKEGEVYGQEAFFGEIPQNFSLQALEFCQCFYLEKDDFMEIIQKSTQDYERYCGIRDSFIQYYDISALFTRCLVCGNKEHFSNKCSQIIFQPDLEKVIKRYDYSHIHNREFFYRSEFKFNCRKRIRIVRETWEHFISTDFFVSSLKEFQFMNRNYKHEDDITHGYFDETSFISSMQGYEYEDGQSFNRRQPQSIDSNQPSSVRSKRRNLQSDENISDVMNVSDISMDRVRNRALPSKSLISGISHISQRMSRDLGGLILSKSEDIDNFDKIALFTRYFVWGNANHSIGNGKNLKLETFPDLKNYFLYVFRFIDAERQKKEEIDSNRGEKHLKGNSKMMGLRFMHKRNSITSSFFELVTTLIMNKKKKKFGSN